MAAPGQRIAAHARGIGELDEEDFFGGQGCDGGKIVIQHQGVETIQNESERGVLGALHDVPAWRHRLTCRPQANAS